MEGKHSPKHAAPTRSARRAPRQEGRPQQEPGQERAQAPVRENMPRKNRPVWQLVIQDILLTGIVLCIFATFHHVIPRLNAKNITPPKPTSIISSPAPVESTAPQETPAPTDTSAPEETPEPPVF